MRCAQCGAENDAGRVNCFNCERALRTRRTPEDWFLAALLKGVFHFFRKAFKTTLDLPRIVKSTVAELKIPPTRCRDCGARAFNKDQDGCGLCEDALESSAISPSTFVRLRILDWLPWAAGVLSVVALAIPTLVFLLVIAGLIWTLVQSMLGQPAGEVVGNILLSLVVSPILAFVLIVGFNLYAFTAKEFITVKDGLLFDRTGVLRFHIRTGIHLVIVLVLLVPFLSVSGVRAAYGIILVAVPQILIFLTPSAFYLTIRSARQGLATGLSEGYSAKVLRHFPVVGRAGGSLDQASQLDETNVRIGQQGEQALSYAISSVVEGRGVVFNSLSVPGMENADLDHVVVVGQTVMIIDSKVWTKGEYSVVQGNVWRDGNPFPGGSVSLDEMLLKLQEFLGEEVEIRGRIVILNNQASLGEETNLSYFCALRLLDGFADELWALVDGQTQLPNAAVLSELVQLSDSRTTYPSLKDSISVEDEWVIYERWKA